MPLEKELNYFENITHIFYYFFNYHYFYSYLFLDCLFVYFCLYDHIDNFCLN